jgi:adenosine deaminase
MIHTDVPLVDLHRHLDGNVRLDTLLDLGRRNHLNLPAWNVEELRPFAQVTTPVADLAHGLGWFTLTQEAFVDYDACQRILWENLEDAAGEGIDYVELRFSPVFMAEIHHLDPLGVAAAVCEAWQEAQNRWAVQSKLIVILSRHYGVDACQLELQAALANRERGVVGIDLAGVETNFPGSLFVSHFNRAREAGLHLTAHAGEWSGAPSVWQAVRELRAERLGHAIGAMTDPALVDLIAEQQIGIEMCPTSNIQFSAVPSLAAHPLPGWLRRGVRVTVNTDDPGISGIDLPHEYRVVHEQMGLGSEEMRRLQANGVDAAFLTPRERQVLWAKKTSLPQS